MAGGGQEKRRGKDMWMEACRQRSWMPLMRIRQYKRRKGQWLSAGGAGSEDYR